MNGVICNAISQIPFFLLFLFIFVPGSQENWQSVELREINFEIECILFLERSCLLQFLITYRFSLIASNGSTSDADVVLEHEWKTGKKLYRMNEIFFLSFMLHCLYGLFHFSYLPFNYFESCAGKIHSSWNSKISLGMNPKTDTNLWEWFSLTQKSTHIPTERIKKEKKKSHIL